MQFFALSDDGDGALEGGPHPAVMCLQRKKITAPRRQGCFQQRRDLGPELSVSRRANGSPQISE